MKYTRENPPLCCLMRQSTNYKDTDTIVPVGFLIHSTGANNTAVSRYVQPDDNDPDRAYWLATLGKNKNGNDYNHKSVQGGATGFLGKLADGTVSFVQTLPYNFRPWTCGKGKKGSCNGIVVDGRKIGWLQFEICEDNLKNEDYFDAIYRESCEVLAYGCKELGLDPHGTVDVNGTKIPVITCHADAHKLGFASNHADVNHWFSRYGKTMETARDDVAALMEEKKVVRYAVQVGAWHNALYAAAYKIKLKLAGFDGYITASGGYTRVQVGSFANKAYAEALRNQLIAKGYSAIIKEKEIG